MCSGETYVAPILGLQGDVTLSVGVSNPTSSVVSVTATYFQVNAYNINPHCPNKTTFLKKRQNFITMDLPSLLIIIIVD